MRFVVFACSTSSLIHSNSFERNQQQSMNGCIELSYRCLWSTDTLQAVIQMETNERNEWKLKMCRHTRVWNTNQTGWCPKLSIYTTELVSFDLCFFLSNIDWIYRFCNFQRDNIHTDIKILEITNASWYQQRYKCSFESVNLESSVCVCEWK